LRPPGTHRGGLFVGRARSKPDARSDGKFIGEAKVKKQCAQEVRDLALASIASLTKILSISKNECREGKFHELKRSVGSVIGHIHLDILSELYSKHPELNDLK